MRGSDCADTTYPLGGSGSLPVVVSRRRMRPVREWTKSSPPLRRAMARASRMASRWVRWSSGFDQPRAQCDRIWDAFWSGGIANPFEVTEQQCSYHSDSAYSIACSSAMARPSSAASIVRASPSAIPTCVR